MPELSRLTHVEAAGALARARVAVLPVGATEQHGPHLELCTDIAIAEAFARRLSDALGADAVLCPPVPYGLSEHHLHFSGTMTLRPATFAAVLSDIAESLAIHGIRRVLVVNGHGGNFDAVKLAARQARRDQDVLMAHLSWARLAADVIRTEMAGEARYNHACQIETSIAMALVPDIVRPDLIGEADLVTDRDPYTEPHDSVVDVPIWFDEWTANGALGDPKASSVELGERIVAVVQERSVGFARRFMDGLVAGGPRS
ncbi:creatininase family protein [Asanoa sp. NPDC050611]|uniref:creatininase family protein n=1 Tax=Asanoa sp. NPDC050611 TaxID=3157098 RepID=UPI0033E098BB